MGAASSYLDCIETNYDSPTCNADWCMSIWTGGVGGGAVNDFDVGPDRVSESTTTSLAGLARNANTCDDMNEFGFNACDNLKGCCPRCTHRIAKVVNALTNDLLLPAYNDGTVSNCPADKTCRDYGAIDVEIPSTRRATRSLDETTTTTSTTTTEGTTIATTADDSDNDNDLAEDEVEEFASDCSNKMVNDIIQYNETHAAENFFECLFKKVGSIAALADGKAAAAAEVQSPATTTSIASFTMAASFVVAGIITKILA